MRLEFFETMPTTRPRMDGYSTKTVVEIAVSRHYTSHYVLNHFSYSIPWWRCSLLSRGVMLDIRLGNSHPQDGTPSSRMIRNSRELADLPHKCDMRDGIV
jgi:hypothetical protein